MKDHGRLVQHFGRAYFWSVSDSGGLELVSVDRINAAVKEVQAALEAGAADLISSGDAER